MPAVDPDSRPATGSLQLPPGDMDARRKFIGENGKNIRRVEAETRSRITIGESLHHCRGRWPRARPFQNNSQFASILARPSSLHH